MFEESLVESTGMLRPRNHRSIIISVAIQSALAGVLLSIPLIHPEILPLHVPAMSLLAPPPRPVPPPTPPPERVHLESTNATALAAPSAPAPAGPRLVHIDPTVGSDAPPASGPIDIGGGSGPGIPLALGVGTFASAPRVVAAGPSGPGARVRISYGVSAGLLLAPIRPVYPAIAKAAHIEGTVMVQAIISKSGTIESARVVSGPAMLQSSALEAVKSAHYRPYLLSGEPTEVDTTFSIVFSSRL